MDDAPTATLRECIFWAFYILTTGVAVLGAALMLLSIGDRKSAVIVFSHPAFAFPLSALITLAIGIRLLLIESRTRALRRAGRIGVTIGGIAVAIHFLVVAGSN